MKTKRCLPVLLLSLALVGAGCGYPRPENDTVFQASTLSGLAAAVLDGDATFAELARHGDFGIGTFDGLDGEMVCLDGKFYRIRDDGAVYPVSPSEKTPFAVVKFFRSDKTFQTTGELNLDKLEGYIDGQLPSANLFCAVRVDGTFRYVKTRSVPKQNKPYPGLVEATKSQKVFEFRDVRGTLVGFRFPDYAAGINLPGWHLHFITTDRKAGGHLLECSLDPGAGVEVDSSSRLCLTVPRTRAFLKMTRPEGEAGQVGKAER